MPTEVIQAGGAAYASNCSVCHGNNAASGGAIPDLRRMSPETTEQFHDIVRHHEAGRIPPTVMWGATPTLFDPSQAPEGGRIIAAARVPELSHAGALGLRGPRRRPALDRLPVLRATRRVDGDVGFLTGSPASYSDRSVRGD